MANSIERMIADTFMEMAQGLETGSFGKRPKVALTGMGSEHGEENSMAAAIEAAKDGIDVYYIGTLEAEGVTTVKVANDEEGHDKMEEMLKNGEVDAAVTMHFPFCKSLWQEESDRWYPECRRCTSDRESSEETAGERVSDRICRIRKSRWRMRYERK